VIANHPSTPGFQNLLELKEKDLPSEGKRAEAGSAVERVNPGMRKQSGLPAGDLQLLETAIPVSKAKRMRSESGSDRELLPMFALFQSDRNKQGFQTTVQSPMKSGCCRCIGEVQAISPRFSSASRKKQKKSPEHARSVENH